MRSYDQYCPLSKALEVIGERWTPLILRDLALGPKRFTDLSNRLAGIAPNLLSQRLRTLEGHGVVRRRKLPPPAATQVYELTELGAELGPALFELARWGTRFLGPIAPGETFRLEYLLPILEDMVDEESARGVRETYEFHIDGAVFHVEVDDGNVAIRPGPPAGPPDLLVETDFQTFAEVGFGTLTPEEATAAGRGHSEGDPAAMERALEILGPGRVLARVMA
jgi:DNA-binding HxlR family transcriptional regulator